MSNQQAHQVIEFLQQKGVQFDDGLSDSEVAQIQNKFNFLFPPDLLLFLQAALPVSKSFVNWRDGLNSSSVAENIISRLEWPLEGILFDLQENQCWFDIWGDKPDDNDKKVAIVKNCYTSYPKLIPVFAHRYIPAEPNEDGNPIFSVYQTDIIYYGNDLATYFANEFHFSLPDNFEIPAKPKEIEFWSYCVEKNNEWE